ncbi:unnamed protein product [Clonostachys rosea f. rosea IK726]|uniref:Uncharacterized protein n=2 Tax=Bionectria ochroleuca TaxID=29856 RepID=A0A0B7JKU2_BIOOC|nr:unnamed protein product [Clonostachys rosea f. rosea IK726]
MTSDVWNCPGCGTIISVSQAPEDCLTCIAILILAIQPKRGEGIADQFRYNTRDTAPAGVWI